MENQRKIEVGRRVRYHGAYWNVREGLIVEVRGQAGLDRRVGVMTVRHRDGLSFDVITFDGQKIDARSECDVGRLGIGAIELLDKVHGPALIAQAHKIHAAKVAADAQARAEAPHRLAAEQAALVMPAQLPRFYWNGLKDDKAAKLQKAWYSKGQLTNAPEGTISIYARDYERFSALVRACFVVENDTDAMTDYFDSDRIRVTPSHPLYAQVHAAWEAQEAHREQRAAKREAR